MAEEVQTIQAGGPAVALTSSPAVGAGPLERVYAFWLAGMSCDGCIISVTGASEPSLEDLLLGNVPDLPRLISYHPALALEAGEEFIRNYELAASGKLDAPYVIILEGSAVDDSLIVGEGYWAGRGWLTHHLELDKGAIVNYQIVTPSTLMASPKDPWGNPGPYEEAVLNTPILEEFEKPEHYRGIDILRTIRSFDPCMPCTTHIYAGEQVISQEVSTCACAVEG